MLHSEFTNWSWPQLYRNTKVIKSENYAARKKVSLKGYAYHIWSGQSHKPRRQYLAGGHFHFAS